MSSLGDQRVHLASRKKLNFWGAVASIVGLIGIPLALVLYWATPTGAGGDTVNVNSSGQSGGITANQVNVNPSVVNTPKEKGYVLRNVKYGATLVLDSPDSPYKDPKHHVCFATAGTPVILTENTEDMGVIKDYWQQVTIIAGNCANKVGWVARENLQWE
jgi:hypothetical protein